MTEFTATVMDIRLESRTGAHQRWQMLLSATLFSGEASRGWLEAVAPSGATLQVPIQGIIVDGEETWHLVEKPLAAGTSVTGYVVQTDAAAG